MSTQMKRMRWAAGAAAAVLAVVAITSRTAVFGQSQPATSSARSERLQAVLKWHELLEQERVAGAGVADAETRYIWSKRLMESEIEMAPGGEDKRKAVAGHVERMKELRKRLSAAYRTGAAPSRHAFAGDYYYADARSLLDEQRP